jgi:hypothetical protein
VCAFSPNRDDMYHSRVLFALLSAIPFSGIVDAAPRWGTFQADACTGLGIRQYSARLEDISFGASWEAACAQTSATVIGQFFASPTRCRNLGLAGMWGEFDVKDSSCLARWGAFQRDGCTAMGIRQYSSRIENIPSSVTWETACAQTPATVEGQSFASPTRCLNKGLAGMWGEFDVRDVGCRPYWGAFQRDSCISEEKRQYSARLENIPSGVTWEAACEQTPATVNGQHFLKPTRCQNTGLTGMWGEFDVDDPSCAVKPEPLISLEYFHRNDPQCLAGSWCQDGIRLRVRENGTFYFGAVDSMNELDSRDLNFRKVPGRSDASCISFESFRYPGRFIRHSGKQVKLSSGGIIDVNLDAESTFCLKNNRYESRDESGSYLRKSGDSLILSRLNDDPDAWWETLFFEREFATLGFTALPCVGERKSEDYDDIVEIQGPCAGTSLPFQPPRVTCTPPCPAPLADGRTRIVLNCAASTPSVSLSPLVKMRRRKGQPSQGVYLIERAWGICYYQP